MKILIIALFLICSVSALAIDIVVCKTVKVHDSRFFQESLNVEEYPDVTISSENFFGNVARIGASRYSEDEEDHISRERSTGFDKIYKIVPQHLHERFRIHISGSPKQTARGRVYRNAKLLGTRRASLQQQFPGFILSYLHM